MANERIQKLTENGRTVVDSFGSRPATFTEQDFVEKAEIFLTLNTKEREEFMEHFARNYKDRILAEVLKIQNANPTLSNNTKMANKAYNADEIENAAKQYAKLGENDKENFLKEVPGLSRKKVQERGDAIRKEVKAEMSAKAGEKITDLFSSNQPNSKPATKMATEATTATETGKRAKAKQLVLTPDTNKAHKVLLGLEKLAAVAKASGYKGFDAKNLKEKQQGKTTEETAAIYGRQFQTLRRKFILEDGDTLKTKPLANPENELHDKAIAVLKDMFKAANEAGKSEKDGKAYVDQIKAAKELAKDAESWLNKVEMVYATAKKGGTGRAPKLTMDSVPEDFFSF